MMAASNLQAPPAPAAAPDAGLAVLPPLRTEGGSSVVLLEIVRISFESLLANRMRSLLTMLGMIIGVGSVVALLSLGQGATASITSSIEGLGTNLVFVAPGSQQNRGPGSAAAADLTRDDASAIAALHLPLNSLS